ncbi:phosphatase PAP2 family protein [Altererythrobacter soli]|uniref:Phosphatase PAP2 family protein n=1 Tax=Croceibacterium soli TaxID=1739690 RepID=A0A6I4UUN6_9SPHN|nr:phosphatase PAP2 family protein [Croceibacterium soli]MXP42481.1 phosphatase PAP2 family protein [Croceibacterium soli]
MSGNKLLGEAAEPLLQVDRTVRSVFLPYRGTLPVRILSWFSGLGDQPQLRLLAGGMLAAGLLRSDPRMARAGARMLLAHEAATSAKDMIKERIIRSRPRHARTEAEQEPRPGRDERKEQSSFPSGHTAGAVAVARAFSAEYPEHRQAVIRGAGLVALARVPGCAHYPTDIAAGAFIGAVAEAALGILWQSAIRLFSRQEGASNNHEC